MLALVVAATAMWLVDIPQQHATSFHFVEPQAREDRYDLRMWRTDLPWNCWQPHTYVNGRASHHWDADDDTLLHITDLTFDDVLAGLEVRIVCNWPDYGLGYVLKGVYRVLSRPVEPNVPHWA